MYFYIDWDDNNIDEKGCQYLKIIPNLTLFSLNLSID